MTPEVVMQTINLLIIAGVIIFFLILFRHSLNNFLGRMIQGSVSLPGGVGIEALADNLSQEVATSNKVQSSLLENRSSAISFDNREALIILVRNLQTISVASLTLDWLQLASPTAYQGLRAELSILIDNLSVWTTQLGLNDVLDHQIQTIKRLYEKPTDEANGLLLSERCAGMINFLIAISKATNDQPKVDSTHHSQADDSKVSEPSWLHN